MSDVLIVGSGAGGGPLALQLARAGLQVLVLEKGPRHRRQDYSDDELEVLRRGFFTPSPFDEPHTVVTAKTTAPTLTPLGWIAACVGGGTVHMGGYLYRFHPDDFRMRSRFGECEELADWPYTYRDLEPYYCLAERETGVSGQAGDNPFEGPRSRPFPMPPLESHPLASALEEACRRRRLHPFHTPRAINSVPYRDREACSYCDACAGFGCRTGAKGSSQEAFLTRAEATGRCEIRTGCMVQEVLLDGAGRAAGCLYIDASGVRRRTSARVVCVCCSTVESARLLLLSRSSRFPEGLANGSGRVGRHLQFHATTMGVARFRIASHPQLDLPSPHPFLGRSLMDHYFLPEGVSTPAKGGIIRFDMFPFSPIANAELVLQQRGGSDWGLPLKQAMREHFQEFRTVFVEVFHDFLPNSETYMELDPKAKDKWGLPAARIHLGLPRHHARAGKWLLEEAFRILEDLGAEDCTPLTVGGTSAYLVQGACRAGADPETSVLDPFCRTHEAPNLFVVDGSFMPTSGGAPPTLTILANSFRTADRIVAGFRKGEW